MALSLATADMACRLPTASDAFAIPHAETLVSPESAIVRCPILPVSVGIH